MGIAEDLTGRRFGKLVVISRFGVDNYRNTTWTCQCDCDNIVVVSRINLIAGDTKSCGCYQKQRASEANSNENHIAGWRNGKNNPNWHEDRNSLKTDENIRIRQSPDGQEWRYMVYGRDNFTCQDCKKRGIYLVAHHLFSFSEWEELRFDVDNGVTLCKECHDKYGHKGSYNHKR